MLKRVIVLIVLLAGACFLYYWKQASSIKKITPTLSSNDTAKINKVASVATDLATGGNLNDALKMARIVQSYSRRVGYKRGIVLSLNIEGPVLYRKTKYDSALTVLNKALILAKDLNDSALQCHAYLNLGNVYAYIGSHHNAIECYFKGLSIQQKLTSKIFLQPYFNNIGVLFANQKNYQKGLEYLLKAKRIADLKHNERNLDMLTNNIGWIYILIDKKDSAFVFLNQALILAEKTQDKYTLSVCLQNFADLYVKMNDYEKAYSYSSRSYEISKQQGYKDQMVSNLILLGTIALEQDKYDAAENYLLQGIHLAKLLQSKVLIRDVSGILASLYEKERNFKAAFDYYKLYAKTKDTVLNEENSKLITELNTTYTSQQKEDEIRLLKKAEQIQALELSKKKEQLKLQRYINIGMISGFILIMLVVLLIYCQHKLDKKANFKLQQAYSVIAEKSEEIEASKTLVTSRFVYAKRLQDAILSSEKDLSKIFGTNFFVFNKPLYIVSGDFYWCNSRADKTFIIISDCTGHGVPGAFMSMIGNALLNEIINDKKITHTVKIAELLDQRIVQVLHQHEESKQYDGMDISICCIDKNERKIHFTGACHSMYVFKDSLKKIKGNPYSLGGAHHQDKKTFSSTTIDYEEGLSLYFLTDGYCDQSGGVQKKRFASQQFEELLTSINNIPMNNQKEKLEEALEKWQGVIKQRDDILVVGIKC